MISRVVAVDLGGHRPARRRRVPGGGDDVVAVADVLVDAVLARGVADVVEDRLAVGERHVAAPRPEAVAEGVHVGVGPHAGVAEQVPGAAAGLAALEHGVRRPGQVLGQVGRRADARQSRPDDQHVDVLGPGHGTSLGTTAARCNYELHLTRLGRGPVGDEGVHVVDPPGGQGLAGVLAGHRRAASSRRGRGPREARRRGGLGDAVALDEGAARGEVRVVRAPRSSGTTRRDAGVGAVEDLGPLGLGPLLEPRGRARRGSAAWLAGSSRSGSSTLEALDERRRRTAARARRRSRAGRRRSRRRRSRACRRRAGPTRRRPVSRPSAAKVDGHRVEVGGAVDDRGVDDLPLPAGPAPRGGRRGSPMTR